MKTIVRLLIAVAFLGGWTIAAAALHVVITPGEVRVFVVPKHRLGITDTVVDTRHWTADDLAYHPQLISRLLDSGKAMALAHVVGATSDAEAVQRLREALAASSAVPPTTTPAAR
jgi:hypothetical protein